MSTDNRDDSQQTPRPIPFPGFKDVTDQRAMESLFKDRPQPRRAPIETVGATVALLWGPVQEAVLSWLDNRIQDLWEVKSEGWSEARPWIKFTVATVVILILTVLGTTLLSWAAQAAVSIVTAITDLPLPTGSGGRTGLLASITTPVWAYLQTHTAGLPVTGPTAYAAWQLAIVSTGTLSFLTKAFGARLAWGVMGLATGWMAWHGAPAGGRDVALGLTALAFALLSIPALRGFRVRGF